MVSQESDYWNFVPQFSQLQKINKLIYQHKMNWGLSKLHKTKQKFEIQVLLIRLFCVLLQTLSSSFKVVGYLCVCVL